MKYYRHGDVLLIKVDTLPKEITLEYKEGTVALVEGEVTGHAHRVKDVYVQLFENAMKENNYLRGYMRITKPTPIEHEEHKPIELPVGDYIIHIQREYDPIEERKVLD